VPHAEKLLDSLIKLRREEGGRGGCCHIWRPQPSTCPWPNISSEFV